MTTDLKTARKVLKPFIVAAGYKFAAGSKDWGGGEVATAEVASFDKSNGRYRIGCGVDYRLPQEKRLEIWNSYGARLVADLEKAGFEIDLETFGTYQNFIVKLGA